MKRIKSVMIDLDDTTADFGLAQRLKDVHINEYTVSEMFEPGFFRDLLPVPGALVAVRHIISMGYDVQILTQPVANSPHCYLEKVQWVGMWLPELVSKINMVQDKGIVKADYLIDDNPKKWQDKFEANGGKFVHFQYNRGDRDHTRHSNRENWERIVNFFRANLPHDFADKEDLTIK